MQQNSTQRVNTGRPNQYFEFGVRGRKTGWAPKPGSIRKDSDGFDIVDDYFKEDDYVDILHPEESFEPRPRVVRTPQRPFEPVHVDRIQVDVQDEVRDQDRNQMDGRVYQERTESPYYEQQRDHHYPADQYVNRNERPIRRRTEESERREYEQTNDFGYEDRRQSQNYAPRRSMTPNSIPSRRMYTERTIPYPQSGGKRTTYVPPEYTSYSPQSYQVIEAVYEEGEPIYPRPTTRPTSRLSRSAQNGYMQEERGEQRWQQDTQTRVNTGSARMQKQEAIRKQMERPKKQDLKNHEPLVLQIEAPPPRSSKKKSAVVTPLDDSSDDEDFRVKLRRQVAKECLAARLQENLNVKAKTASVSIVAELGAKDKKRSAKESVSSKARAESTKPVSTPVATKFVPLVHSGKKPDAVITELSIKEASVDKTTIVVESPVVVSPVNVESPLSLGSPSEAGDQSFDYTNIEQESVFAMNSPISITPIPIKNYKKTNTTARPSSLQLLPELSEEDEAVEVVQKAKKNVNAIVVDSPQAVSPLPLPIQNQSKKLAKAVSPVEALDEPQEAEEGLNMFMNDAPDDFGSPEPPVDTQLFSDNIDDTLQLDEDTIQEIRSQFKVPPVVKKSKLQKKTNLQNEAPAQKDVVVKKVVKKIKKEFVAPKSNGEEVFRPVVNEDDPSRRSKRNKIAPVAFWKNEKVVYNRRESGMIETYSGISIQKIMRPPVAEEFVYNSRAKPKVTKKRTAKVKEEIDEREESEDSDFVDENMVPEMVEVFNYTTKQQEFQKVAVTTKTLDRTMGNGPGAYRFQRVFSEGEYIATGVLDLPPGIKKPSKNSHSSSMFFTVLTGKIQVDLNGTSFHLGRGGQFFVPRGNLYSIGNVGTKNCMLSFCHGKHV